MLILRGSYYNLLTAMSTYRQLMMFTVPSNTMVYDVFCDRLWSSCDVTVSGNHTFCEIAIVLTET